MWCFVRAQQMVACVCDVAFLGTRAYSVCTHVATWPTVCKAWWHVHAWQGQRECVLNATYVLDDIDADKLPVHMQQRARLYRVQAKRAHTNRECAGASTVDRRASLRKRTSMSPCMNLYKSSSRGCRATDQGVAHACHVPVVCMSCR